MRCEGREEIWRGEVVKKIIKLLSIICGCLQVFGTFLSEMVELGEFQPSISSSLMTDGKTVCFKP
jgi:hypothetical protein